jgi:signal transduction histidine kinase
MRTHISLTASVVLTLAITGCGKHEPEPDYKASATIREIMASMVVPSADFLFNAVSSSVTPKGVEEKSPKTDEEWAEVRHRAITLMEASDLIVLAGRHVAAPGQKAINPQVQLSPEEIETLIAKERSSWVKMAHDLHDSVLPTLKAIDSKDPMALSDSSIAIDMACESCHLKFWYPDKP